MTLFLSSVISGLVATGVMIIFLYLPVLWKGVYYDTIGSLGSIVLHKVDTRSRILGVILLLVGGVLFAFFYGWYALMFIQGPFPALPYIIFPGSPFEVNLFYPLFGLIAGFCHGIFITLILTFVITDHHPLENYRQAYPLILSFIIGHTVYGMTVMFLQSEFLQPLAGSLAT